MYSKLCIKVASVAIILGLIVVPLGVASDVDSSVIDPVYDEDMESCYTTTDTINFRNTKVNTSIAVGTWAGHWNPARDVWEYNFKIGGMGVSGIDCINKASMKVEGPPSFVNICMSDLDAYIWSNPRSQAGEIQQRADFSTLVVDVLLALVPIEDTFEDVWTVASDVMSLLGNGADYRDNNSMNRFNYSWEWSPLIGETTQQIWILADV